MEKSRRHRESIMWRRKEQQGDCCCSMPPPVTTPTTLFLSDKSRQASWLLFRKHLPCCAQNTHTTTTTSLSMLICNWLPPKGVHIIQESFGEATRFSPAIITAGMRPIIRARPERERQKKWLHAALMIVIMTLPKKVGQRCCSCRFVETKLWTIKPAECKEKKRLMTQVVFF